MPLVPVWAIGGSDKGTSWVPKRRDRGRKGSWERKPEGGDVGNNKAGWKQRSKSEMQKKEG